MLATSASQDHGGPSMSDDLMHCIQNPAFRLITTFCPKITDLDPKYSSVVATIAPPCIPLAYHRDRLHESAAAFGWAEAAASLVGASGSERIANALSEHLPYNKSVKATKEELLKIRLALSRSGEIEVELAQIGTSTTQRSPMLPQILSLSTIQSPLCAVYLDTKSTSTSLLTTCKTNQRHLYNDARRRANIFLLAVDVAEVLLLNVFSEITEASLSTPYFFRHGRWVTPPLSCGGNCGVTRRFALNYNLCVEEIVKADSLRDGEILWISNGVRGFVQGTFSNSYRCGSKLDPSILRHDVHS